MFEPSSQELHIAKMVVFLRASGILRLRDHFYAQDQMFRRHAARVALCFGVRIHVVMVSPSVMSKVVFLFEAAAEGWLITRRDRRVVRSVWSVVVQERSRRRLETRCLPARISTTGHCIRCHDTEPHDRACATSGRQVRGMRTHVIPRCGCPFLHSRDTAEATLQLNRAMLAQELPRSHS